MFPCAFVSLCACACQCEIVEVERGHIALEVAAVRRRGERLLRAPFQRGREAFRRQVPPVRPRLTVETVDDGRLHSPRLHLVHYQAWTPRTIRECRFDAPVRPILTELASSTGCGARSG